MKDNNKKTIIFDLDGTLYQFKNGGIKDSGLYFSIIENTLLYIEKYLNKTKLEAQETLDFMMKKYGNSLSVALEKEFGINRYDYFNFAWDIDPSKYITFNPKMKLMINDLANNYHMILLSDAPRIWIDKALNLFEIKNVFKENIFSGESDIRKEFGNGFEKLVEKLNLNPKDCISVGDQEKTDIIPANKLGMKTIYIGVNKSNVSDFSIRSILEVSDIISHI